MQLLGSCRESTWAFCRTPKAPLLVCLFACGKFPLSQREDLVGEDLVERFAIRKKKKRFFQEMRCI